MVGHPRTASERPPAPAGGGRLSAARIAVLIVAALAIVAGLALTVSGLGWFGPDTSPATATTVGAAASAAYPDLSLVPVVATDVPVASPSLADASNVAEPAEPAASTAAPATGIPARHIRIQRLDIDLKVVEGDGIDAPIGKAAHYPGTAWPGDGSNIYIYGHAREGMFINLWKAKVGDVIELDLDDGTTRTYVVDEVLPKVPWDAVKYLRPAGTERLTLQTSTSYHPTSPRFIVIAFPVP